MPWWQLALIVLAFPVGCAAAVAWVMPRYGRMPTAPGAAAPLPAPAAAAPPELHPTVAEALGELASVRAEWMAWKKQVEAFLEEFDELAETIERRRSRIAASVSKREQQLKRAESPAPDANGAEALRQRARSLGIPV